VTPHLYTTLDEVDFFASALEEISRKGLTAIA
jgi:selenocysteine lyase/cysteine desulfurase